MLGNPSYVPTRAIPMLHWDKSQLPQGDRASPGRPGEGVGQRKGLGPWGAGTGFTFPLPI